MASGSSESDHSHQLTVHFKLRRPPQGTPPDARIYVVGDFNGWRPRDRKTRLKRGADGGYELSLTLPPDLDEFQYLVTRGNWETLEVRPDGERRANRRFNKDDDTTVELEVSQWRDLCEPVHTIEGELILDQIFMPGFLRNRVLRILLPLDYRESEKHYPVLYMHDAQNLFDEATAFSGEWQVDETLARLQREGRTNGMIVVGIDNGGPHRLDEYGPWPFHVGSYRSRGYGRRFGSFIVNAVKPYIDKHYRTLPQREHTFLMGSSMGGLISLYVGLKYQDRFGGVAALSPTVQPLYVGQNLAAWVRSNPVQESMRFYLDAGDSEGGGKGFTETVRQLSYQLRDAGLGERNLRYRTIYGGVHGEHSWATRFGDIALWLTDKA